MKKIKTILAISVLSLSVYIGTETYNHITMTEAESLMLKNIEAIAQEESYPLGDCVMEIYDSEGVYIMPCDSRTTNNILYNCPVRPIKAHWETTARCIKN